LITEQKLTLIDLFAGCGGLSLGLEQAGFTSIMVNELNADARQSYLMNRKNQKIIETDDIKGIVKALNSSTRMGNIIKDMHNIGDIDLIAGGPPCQGFSGIGGRRSFSVDKEQLPSNYLYEDMAFVVSNLKPKMFLFENVQGLLSSKWTPSGSKGEIWEDVLQVFNSIRNYRIEWQLVYCRDYGVPQSRPRIVMVGIRNDIDFKSINLIPTGNQSPPTLQELWGDLIDPNYENGGETIRYPSEPQNDLQKRLRGQSTWITEHKYSKHAPRIVKKFQYMIENNGEIPVEMQTKKFSQRLLSPIWDKNGPNITVTSLADDYVHWAQPRSLTVREVARLQMFPDSYQFAGKRTTGGTRRAGNPRAGEFDRELPKYTQIANAVPVELARHIGNHLKTLIA
tara:strand:- start:407 stop:1594 length:1188 start_codon:yes stop_codon:yes gene_type:complete